MYPRISLPLIFVAGAFLSLSAPFLFSDEREEVKELAPTPESLAKLGEIYMGQGFSVCPPKELKFAGSKKLGGLRSYGWTHPAGISLWSFSVSTTVGTKPSQENLEKTEAGMKESLSASCEKLVFEKSQNGRLHGTNIRYNSFSGVLNDIPFKGIYMIGIDGKGTFSTTSLIPEENASEDCMQAAQTAILSFERVK